MKSLSNSHGFRLCLDCSTIFQTDKKKSKRHGFKDTINPIYAFRTAVETTEQFVVRCNFYSTQRV